MCCTANWLRPWGPWLGLLLLAGFVAGGWGAWGVAAQDQATRPGAPRPPVAFPAPFMTVFAGGTGSGWHLRDARLEKRADRSFLVGTALDAEGWTRGLKIEVAWDKVDSIVVYDSAEQFEERIREMLAEAASGMPPAEDDAATPPPPAR